MGTSTVSFVIDENLKHQAESIFDELGLNMSTAFTMFTKAVVRSGGIPLELVIDPFYQAENQHELQSIMHGYKSGADPLIPMPETIEGLEALLNG